jgi:hypothetical protein
MIKKIFEFMEGNIKMLGDRLNLLSEHEREQVLYRSGVCKKDCVKYGYCIKCGCDLPGKFYVGKSCNNGSRFPDLMGKTEWEQYKKDKNIKLIEYGK